MAQAGTTAAVLTEEPRETEEMDNQELLELLRADLGAAETRSDRRFEEVKQEIKEMKQDIAASEQRVTAYVDKRIGDLRHEVTARLDDLRQDIHAARIFKNSWYGVAIAALATAAVLGTFILQLMEAIL